MRRHIPIAILGLAVSLSCARMNERGMNPEKGIPPANAGLPLVFSDNFDQGCRQWIMTDPDAWEIACEEENRVLALCRASKYRPDVQSPSSIARIAELEVADFVLEARMKQTGREYDHRDLCLFFGYQDPSHFYYVHLATKADAHANSIFLVNSAPRVSIATERTEGTDWGNAYHQVRVVRNAATGAIEVFFDDMTRPIMRAVDKTFLTGGVGIGSFDDVGRMDNVRVWGRRVDSGGPWQSLFDGETLKGWIRRGGQAHFEAKDNTIVGTTAPGEPNSFLCTEKHFGNFILELEVKVDSDLNSGIQIRSQSREDYRNGVVHGYQVEVDPSERAWSGGVYDESRRGWLYDLKSNEAARQAFRVGQWNRYRILALGDTIRTWVNGVPAADLTDSMTPEGFIGLQVHATSGNTPKQVSWRNIQILPLD